METKKSIHSIRPTTLDKRLEQTEKIKSHLSELLAYDSNIDITADVQNGLDEIQNELLSLRRFLMKYIYFEKPATNTRPKRRWAIKEEFQLSDEQEEILVQLEESYYDMRFAANGILKEKYRKKIESPSSLWQPDRKIRSIIIQAHQDGEDVIKTIDAMAPKNATRARELYKECPVVSEALQS